VSSCWLTWELNYQKSSVTSARQADELSENDLLQRCSTIA
jgi:hypothetical protein